MKKLGVFGLMVILSLVGCQEVLKISEEARRENLLMPAKDSKTYTEWVEKYGDNAESWTLFTTVFHTKYMIEMNQRLTALEQQLTDPNKVESPPVTELKS